MASVPGSVSATWQSATLIPDLFLSGQHEIRALFSRIPHLAGTRPSSHDLFSLCSSYATASPLMGVR